MVFRVRCFWLSLGVAMLISIFAGSHALAVGNLKFGLVEVHPEISVGGGYDDNVFLDHDDEEDDSFLKVTPGINFLLEKEDQYFNVGYKVDIIRYDEFDSQDSENHTAYGVLKINFPGALFIKLENIFQDTSDYATSELVDRVDRSQNNGNASIGFTFSDDFSIQADYLSVYHKYDPDEYIDSLDLDKLGLADGVVTALEDGISEMFDAFNRFEQEFGPAVYVRIMPKTSAILEYHYGIIDYADVDDDIMDDNSSTFHQVMGGLKWEVTGKSTGTLKAGYQWKDYDEDENLDGTDKDDKDTWVVSGDVDVDFTPKTSANLQLKRSIVESSFTDNDYYVENRASVEVNQKLLEKVALILGASYYQNRYHEDTMDVVKDKEIKRKDKIFEAEVGLEYEIQEWLLVGGNYEYQDRDSNSTIHDYKDNQVNGYVTLAF